MCATRCRIWWPMPLSAVIPPSDLLLFGWCFDSGSSIVDMVVSSGIPARDVDGAVLKDAIQHANGKVPRSLQECSTLSLLGHCAVDIAMKNADLKETTNDKTHVFSESANGDPHDLEKREEGMTMTSDGEAPKKFDQLSYKETSKVACDCKDYGLAMSLEKERLAFIQNGNWIQLHFGHPGFLRKRLAWIPKLNHLHWKGKLFFTSHLHVYHII